MVAKFGKSAKPQRIKPGGSTILAGPREAKMKMVDVDIKEQTPEKDWKLVITETWACDPRFRKFLFLYRSPKNTHILFHSVSERITTPQPKP
ncbi:hypothetical protein [Haloferula sp.]|uniref:hypothetical protein n=1 Tax=Haloferula sp. TaxID=2497595 RepID=UPI003C73A82B